jgi:hypothetical protein
LVFNSVLNPYLERQRLNVVLITIFFNVFAVLLLGRAHWSDWRSGLALNLFDNLLLLIHVFRMRDLLMLRLMFFGLVLGFAELVADAWLADATGTLDYSIGGGPMLWRSPIWMPLAWEIVAVQFGYIGLRLYETMGWQGLFFTGVIGAANIPFYEEMAVHTHWWEYHNCRMISHTPWYIIAGEFLIALSIGRLATCVRQRGWWRVFIAGLLGGLGILASYAVAYLFTDKIWTLMR